MNIPFQYAHITRGRSNGRMPQVLGIVPQVDWCAECETDLAKAIEFAANNGACTFGCTGLGAAAASACVVAFGGPEDPVGDIVCPIAGVAVRTACNQLGSCSDLKNPATAQSVANAICTKIPSVC